MNINLVQLFEKLGTDIHGGDLACVDLSALASLDLNAVAFTPAELNDILVDSGFSLSPAQRRSIASLAAISTESPSNIITAPSGDSVGPAVDEAFASVAGHFAIDSIRARACRFGVDDALVESLLGAVILDLKRQLRSKTLLDLSGGPSATLASQLFNENIGTLAIAGTPPTLLLGQGVPTLLLNTDRSVIDPASPLGQTIIIVDMLLEIAGVFLLFVNVTLPKVNWNRIIEVLNQRRVWTAFEFVTDALARLARGVANGEALDKILMKALSVLKQALGTDALWEVIEAALDLPWYEWLRIAATVVLLSTLDVATGGFAIAGKVALAGVTIYDVVRKAQKLAPAAFSLAGGGLFPSQGVAVA